MLAWLGGAKKRLRASRGSASQAVRTQPLGPTSPVICKKQQQRVTAASAKASAAAACGDATAKPRHSTTLVRDIQAPGEPPSGPVAREKLQQTCTDLLSTVHTLRTSCKRVRVVLAGVDAPLSCDMRSIIIETPSVGRSRQLAGDAQAGAGQQDLNCAASAAPCDAQPAAKLTSETRRTAPATTPDPAPAVECSTLPYFGTCSDMLAISMEGCG